ncbi:formaldehyde-activating enzyme [Cupriavidus sp. TMH.W2]|uniref:formaldehyde-activating enzyme n=1 Tax=Cupriavidus sp. TMH.W2 TaxID=3434465 RepID=UPI003D76F546
MMIGEAASGNDHNRAHVNVVLGDKMGPLGTAFANTMGRGQPGQMPFTVVVKPGMIARPITLFVNKRPCTSEFHTKLTYGAAQMGVSKALVESFRDLPFPDGARENWVAIVAVLVPDDADDEDAVFLNNLFATRTAIKNGLRGAPSFDECLGTLEELGNRFYKPSASMRAR